MGKSKFDIFWQMWAGCFFERFEMCYNYVSYLMYTSGLRNKNKPHSDVTIF